VGWMATVHNNGLTDVHADWSAELQIMVRGGGFDAVTDESGSGDFGPGDTPLAGSLCYDFPPDTVQVRVEFYIDTSGYACQVPSHDSHPTNPCQ
jgi:hypothetical protein